MKILHISDFHYKDSAKDIAAQAILVDKLVENLPEPGTIDFLIFSGDLVFSGKKAENFQEAYLSFIERIGFKLKLKKRNIIICPGNHDVDRSTVSEPVKQYIRKVSSPDELAKLIEENREDIFGLSCNPTKNYYDFEKQFYTLGEGMGIDKVNKLITTHIRQYDKWKIGFASINTAWCSTGDDDKGNLFFPKSELEKAVYYFKKERVDWKILVLHHPLSDLREFNKIDIEDFIYSEFHFMFSGHLHKREDFIRLTQNEGIFGTYAHAAFTKKQDGKIGYSILEIDLDTLDVILHKYIYDFEEMHFLPLKEMNFTFPCNEAKADQIKVFKTLRKKLHEICNKADELCITTKENSPQKGFLELFVNPVLKSQPQVDVALNFIQAQKIHYNTLLKSSNYLILGKDKTGKTTLLFKINIDLLSNYSQLGEIPYYLDLATYKNKAGKLDLLTHLSIHLEHSKNQTQKILKNYKFKLLLDNFDPSQKEIVQKLSAFLKEYPTASYILTCDQTLAQSYELLDYGIDGYEKLFIHDISRNEIRQLTNKWPNIPKEKKDEFADRIIEVLKQHSMPFNFWTLSIFLWIFAGKNTLNFNSNSELIELYIDDILDRNSLASNPQNRFSYPNYKLLLSELAHDLLVHHLESNYAIKYADLINFTEKFKEKNIKRVGKTSEIVSHLLERGILKRLDDDFVTFRLNGVFEYFIAYNFIENKSFLNSIIVDNNLYLSFKNEFEIYSGFQRTETENQEFLSTIFSKTQSAFEELNNRLEGDIDQRLNQSVTSNTLLDLSKPLSELISKDIQPLSGEQKDQLLDDLNIGIFKGDIDVKPKKLYDVSIKRFDILERYLFINGRVFKNIENINDSVLIGKVFDFMIDSSCNLGFLLAEEFEKALDNHEIEELDYSNTNKVIFQLVSNYLPTLVQSFIQDAIGHINLEGIILNKINTLKKDFRNNQFKLFILYSLLLDIDLKKYKHFIDEMIGFAKLGIIKTSLLVKIGTLLLLKSYDDDKMIAFLKEKLRVLNLQINPKADMGEFERKFEKAKQLIILKRQIE